MFAQQQTSKGPVASNAQNLAKPVPTIDFAAMSITFLKFSILHLNQSMTQHAVHLVTSLNCPTGAITAIVVLTTIPPAISSTDSGSHAQAQGPEAA